MERSNAYRDKIGHQTVTQKSVEEIAHPASEHERKTNETPQVQSGVGYQISSEREQAGSDTQSEYDEPRRIRKQGAETQEGARIFGEA
jgi:hypothetical protein